MHIRTAVKVSAVLQAITEQCFDLSASPPSGFGRFHDGALDATGGTHRAHRITLHNNSSTVRCSKGLELCNTCIIFCPQPPCMCSVHHTVCQCKQCWFWSNCVSARPICTGPPPAVTTQCPRQTAGCSSSFGGTIRGTMSGTMGGGLGNLANWPLGVQINPA